MPLRTRSLSATFQFEERGERCFRATVLLRLAGPYREAASAPLVLGVIDAQTGKAVRTFHNFTPSSASGSVGWEPGDQAIIYSTNERTNVWRRTLADGRETRLTNLSDQAIARFALSPDRRTLLLSRGITTRDAFLISNFH